MNVTLFFGKTNPELSNFYVAPIEINGVTYNSSEHYFMYQKAKLFDPDGELIEGLVLKKCRELLTDENIKKIAAEVAAMCRKMQNNGAVSMLRRKIRETDRAIENLIKALEGGMHIDIIGDKITENRNKKELLERELHEEKRKLITLSELDVRFFLSQLKNGDIKDIKHQKTLIKIFVNSIYLFDDKLTIIFNAGEEPAIVDNILLDEIAESSESVTGLYSDACGSPKEEDTEWYLPLFDISDDHHMTYPQAA